MGLNYGLVGTLKLVRYNRGFVLKEFVLTKFYCILLLWIFKSYNNSYIFVLWLDTLFVCNTWENIQCG